MRLPGVASQNGLDHVSYGPHGSERCHVQGDNNWGDDRALYNEGQQWLNLNHLMGRVVG